MYEKKTVGGPRKGKGKAGQAEKGRYSPSPEKRNTGVFGKREKEKICRTRIDSGREPVEPGLKKGGNRKSKENKTLFILNTKRKGGRTKGEDNNIVILRGGYVCAAKKKSNGEESILRRGGYLDRNLERRKRSSEHVGG